MIKVTILLTRNEALTREQFIAYHRTEHAALFSSIPVVKETVRQYVQQHALGVTIPGLPPEKYDGVTELWFDDLDGFGRCFSDDDYMRLVRPDEMKFLNLEACEIVITHENVVLH